MIELFVLVLMRVSGMLIGAPIFTRSGVPVRFRVALAVALTPWLLVPARGVALPADAVGFAGALVAELAVGLAFGVLVRLLFSGFQIAGTIMGFQMGLAMANVLDPDSGTQSSALASLHLQLAGMMFLMVDGHHLLIRSLADSFQAFPVGATLRADVLGEVVFASGAGMWEAGARIAAPVTGIMMLINAVLGLVNRILPQMSIFNVGFPLSALAGYLAILVTVEPTAAFFYSAYDGFARQLGALLGY